MYQHHTVLTVTLNPAIDQTVVIPNFVAGQVNRVTSSTFQPGGKGVNVAAVLADAGLQVGVTGFLGEENDAPFCALFTDKAISDAFIRIGGQTRISIKITDPVQAQTTDINFAGQPPAPADVDRLLNALDALDSPWVVLAGSIPPGLPATIYRDIVAQVQAQGRKVALDTSGEALRHAVAAQPAILKPNIHELAELVGDELVQPTDVVHAAHDLLGGSTELVVVSMGGDGALFVCREQAVLARPPRVTVQSTVGAGDAMVAGLVAAAVAELDLAEQARLATAYSLDVITHHGTGLSTLESVAYYRRQVSVEPVTRTCAVLVPDWASVR